MEKSLRQSAVELQRGDKNCSDFPNQAAAQRFYLNHDPQQDPDGLDADHDGIACEANPCPCDHTLPGGGGGGGGGDGGPPPPPPARKERARVISITDGDTIRVRSLKRRFGSRPVRLIGINTPEVYFHQECGGELASRAMKRLLHPGQHVTLVTDPSQDKVDRYGRLLRYVIAKDGDVGRRQIVHGWAHVYVYAHNPFKRVKPYRQAQGKAERHHRGVWGRCRHF